MAEEFIRRAEAGRFHHITEPDVLRYARESAIREDGSPC